MSHTTVKCTINVDKKIAPIVQYFLDNYQYELIPFSSCQENGDGNAFVMLLVRDIKAFNDFLKKIEGLYSLHVEYSANVSHTGELHNFTISWPAKDTNSLNTLLEVEGFLRNVAS